MDNYFIFNGVTYVIIYDDKKIKVLKKVDKRLKVFLAGNNHINIVVAI